MTGSLYALGHFCVRRRHLVLAVWLIAVVALVAISHSAGHQESDNLSLPGTGSQRATDMLQTRFAAQANGTNPVALRAPGGAKLTDAKWKSAVEQTVASLRRTDGVAKAVSPFDAAGATQLTKDGRTGYVSLSLKDSPSTLTVDEAHRIIGGEQPAKDAGLTVATGGYLGQKVSKPATEKSEVLGLAVAIVVLLLTFGTVVAMGLPIITAIFGLGVGLSVITLLGHVDTVPSVAPTLATMIGLGVGIDYALFIITRHRSQLDGGMAMEESIARANATSGGSVAFAGVTVIIALLSLILAGIPIVATLGYTAAIAVVVAVAAALTLLPAILAVLGPRINALPIPHPKPADDGRPHGWVRWAHFVAARPVPAIVVSVVILAALAWPVIDLHLGQQDVGSLSKDTTARQAYDLMSAGFGPGANGPLLVAARLDRKAAPDAAKKKQLTQKHDRSQQQQEQKAAKQIEAGLLAQGVPPQVAGPQASKQAQAEVAKKTKGSAQEATYEQNLKALSQPASDPRLVSLRDDIAKQPDVKSVTPALVNPKGTAAIYTVTPKSAPSDRSTEDLVTHLRTSTIPAAAKGQQLTAYVGGRTAAFVDLAERISGKLVTVILIVVGLSFIVLMLAFRSLAIPLKAGLMNLVSIGAAFGVVSAVFEKGWGIGAVGLSHEVPIVSFVPLLMFAILFGLSMDYEVFLMSQMREHYQRSRDNHEAVVDGLAATGRVITSAALIMVAVFSSFILNGDPTVKQFGVGLAVAVAVDATIVRCLLVPAVMAMMGTANWWMPAWLDRWTPSISIEGEEWFREHDIEAAIAAGEPIPDEAEPELAGDAPPG